MGKHRFTFIILGILLGVLGYFITQSSIWGWIVVIVGVAVLIKGFKLKKDNKKEETVKEYEEEQDEEEDNDEEEPEEIDEEEEDNEEYRFCDECGEKVKKTAKFCKSCGKKL